MSELLHIKYLIERESKRGHLKKALDLYSDCIINYKQLETLIAMINSEDSTDLELANIIMVNKREQNGNTIQI